ncbi:MAG: molybdate ABC transporter permease subunit, partial [Actinomycetota bacterium]
MTRPADRAPRGIALLAGTAIVLLLLPLAGLALRAPWGRLPDLLDRPEALAAIRLSVTTSLAALGLATVLGIPLAWMLARRRFPGRELVRALAV